MALTKSGSPVDIRPATRQARHPHARAWAPSPPPSWRASRRSAAGMAKPIGSLTQMGTIRLGKRTDNRSPLIKEFVPLAKLDDLVFGGWDLFPDDAYQAAAKAGVLRSEHLRAAQGVPVRHQADDRRCSSRSTSRS